MQTKISKLALWTMPCFVAVSLSACGGSSSSSSSSFDPAAPSKYAVKTIDLPTPEEDVVQSEAGYLMVQWLDPEYGSQGSKDPSGFSLHLWDQGCAATTQVNANWDDQSVTPEGKNDYGPYWKLTINNDNADGCMGVIVRDADKNKLQGDQKLVWTADDHSITLSAKKTESYATTKEAFEEMGSSAGLKVDDASAHWLTERVIVWKNAGDYNVRMHYDPESVINSDGESLTGTFINLTPTTLSDELKEAHPNLADFKAFEIPADVQIDAKKVLKGEALLVGLDNNNETKLISKVQTASLIDELYVNDSLLAVNDFGLTVNSSGATFKLWAPTAQKVKLHLWPKAGDDKWDEVVGEMTYDEATGIWSYTASDVTADGKAAYKYELNVYHPETRKIEDTWATDPYSLSILSGNSAVVDLNSELAKPDGWDDLKAPHSQKTEADIAAMLITESHIRDLTVGSDKGVAEDKQGKYLGLTDTKSNVGKHLKALSQAGVTHIEFLPLYDIASIDEDKVMGGKTLDVTITGAEFCKRADVTKTEGVDVCGSAELVYDLLAAAAADDSKDSKNVDKFLVEHVKNNDSYNWGYDPWHYQVPEGSYATSIKDPYVRIKEIREMFQTVKKEIGMNVILDVVYNHTDGSGVEKNSSVLDRIVPWYYNRLNAETGAVIHDTCCEDTAGEHKMFAKLMEDTLVTWAKDYKVDAFRFDLMGYLPKQVMVDTLANVKKRTENDEMYFFGEGWDAGSAEAAIGTGKNATQKNMGGTGIGTFNDRIRDGVRGSGPFDHGENLIILQGFASGACVDENAKVKGSQAGKCDEERVKNFQDIIRISMAGNLQDYELETYTGDKKLGKDISYWDSLAGYGLKPIDTINYVSKHDNQTQFDLIMYKANKDRTMEEKARMHGIGLATVILGQSPAFDQQGSDLLRTKYFQNDSYNTGDFSNKVNYDMKKGNEFIPGALVNYEKDQDDWDAILEVSKYNSDVGADVKAKMVDTYQKLATIRKNNDALHLGDAELIKSNVKFLNTGANQTVGLIVMHAKNKSDGKGGKNVVVMLNANPSEKSLDAGVTDLGTEDTGLLYSDSCTVSGTTLTAKAWSVCVFTDGAEVTLR